MARYAEGTTVPVERSRAEVEALVARYGARKFASGYDDDARLAVVQFEMRDRRVQFRLHLPNPASRDITHDGRGRQRTALQRQNAYEQECRRLWRSLVMVIKAKLESVESGIESFEEAFMANVVLPGGMTVGDYMTPQIAESYRTGQMPPMLPGVDPAVLALGRGQA